MKSPALHFKLLPDAFSVARLAADEAWPAWLPSAGFVSISRTSSELSVVCISAAIPPDVRCEEGWRILALQGPIPFETVGVAAAFTTPLAEAGISVFVLSTYDTDYLLVKETSLERAVSTLRSRGFLVDV